MYAAVAGLVLALAILEFFAATDPETATTSPKQPRLRRSTPSMFRQRLPAFAGCVAVAALVIGAYEGLD